MTVSEEVALELAGFSRKPMNETARELGATTGRIEMLLMGVGSPRVTLKVLRKELVHQAAVCIALVEQIDESVKR
jgi:hypothetical protein